MRLLLLCLVVGKLFAQELMDLEAEPDPYVLRIKQISVPGYPHAFNPSVIAWHEMFLMSFRDIPNPKDSYRSTIGFIWLNSQFEPVGDAQIFTFRDPVSTIPSRAEDGRLFFLGDKPYFLYSDNEEAKLTGGGFRMVLCEVLFEGLNVVLKRVDKWHEFEGASPTLREKSWTPFIYEQSLLLSYSFSPHTIFSPVLGTGLCRTVAESTTSLNWPWGDLRGGTPALQGVADNGDYLTFFHSSIRMPSVQSGGKAMRHYFFGALTFSSEPPFQITRMSPRPITAKGFYSGPVYQHYWNPLRVVFPAGYVFDTDNIHVFYGRQDHEIWVATIDRAALLQSLVPVE
jgi:predicted GH43/DUF377 family glycosyl hydrolase